MSVLILQPEGEWVRLLGVQNNKSFIDYLKYNIKPTTFRRYDVEKKSWLVYWKALQNLLLIANQHYENIDGSHLPNEWQELLNNAEIKNKIVEETTDPFSVLFVTENAPLDVVRAAYKALAMIYHPDLGGNVSQMTQINEAYTKICNLRAH